ncbi:MAG: MerR family transcriptional regulator [Opitutales bacterium]|nr:MerR family transcriptional regulator [Opitutales bacterium]
MSKNKIVNPEDSPNRQPQFDALLSRAEVSRRLGVCRHTVRLYERRGYLPSIRLTARYRTSDVDSLIRRLRG